MEETAVTGLPNSLLTKSLGAAAWGYAGSILRLLVQLSAQIVLARILGPAEYGQFAIAVILVSATVFFTDIASSALIQMALVEEQQLRFAFTCQVVAGALATLLLIVASDSIAAWLDKPGTRWVIVALAPVCLINAVSGVSLAMLRKRLDFRIIQLCQTTGYFVGYILIAIPISIWFSPTVLALVVAWIIQACLTTALLFWQSPHCIRPVLTCSESKHMLAFGRGVLLANVSNWALSNIDRIIVAKFSPVQVTGLYTTTANLLTTPLSQLLGTFQSVVFATSAQMEEEDKKKVFLVLLGLISLVAWSMYGFIVAVPDTFIVALYGSKWIGGAPYLLAFSVAFSAYATLAAVTPLLWGSGAPRREAVPQFWMAICLLVGAWIAIRESALAVAWTLAAIYVCRCIWIVGNGAALFGARLTDIVPLLFRIACFVTVLSVCCRASDQLLMDTVQQPALRLGMVCMVFVALFGAALTQRSRVFGSLLGSAMDKPIRLAASRIRHGKR